MTYKTTLTLLVLAIVGTSVNAAADFGECTAAQCCTPMVIDHCTGNTHTCSATTCSSTAKPSCTGTATDATKTCDLDATTDSSAACPAGCTEVTAPTAGGRADYTCSANTHRLKANSATIAATTATDALCCDLVPQCAATTTADLNSKGYTGNNAATIAGATDVGTSVAIGTIGCHTTHYQTNALVAPTATCAGSDVAFVLSGCTVKGTCSSHTCNTAAGYTDKAGKMGLTGATNAACCDPTTGFCMDVTNDAGTGKTDFASCAAGSYVVDNMQSVGGDCVETATTSVAADKTACEGVTGTALLTATACEAIATVDSTDAADAKACTYTAGTPTLATAPGTMDVMCPAPTTTTSGTTSGASKKTASSYLALCAMVAGFVMCR